MRTGIISMWLFSMSLAVYSQEPLLKQATYYSIDPVTKENTPSWKYTDQYDSRGKLRAHTIYGWVTNNWTPQERDEYEYDNFGNKVWSRKTSWVNYETEAITTYQYNSLNQLIGSVSTYSNGAAISEYTLTISYKPNGCPDKQIGTTKSNGEMSSQTVSEYFSDVNCRNLRVVFTDINMSYPIQIRTQVHLEEYEYENDLLLAKRIYSIVESDTLLRTEDIYRYNANGQLTFGEIDNYQKIENTYDNEGNLAVRQTYYWNQETSTWDYPSRVTFSYNTKNLLVLAIVQGGSRTEYEYNTDDKLVRMTNYLDENLEKINERIINYRCDGVKTEAIDSYFNGGVTTFAERIIYEYLLPATCESLPATIVQLFPNPTTGLTQVSLNEQPTSFRVRVFASTGQLIKELYSEEGVLPVEIDLSALQSGIYTVQVSSGSFTEASRLVKY